MSSRYIVIIPCLCCVLLLPSTVARATQSEAIFVDASELDRRQDLVGKLVKTDDRVRFYQARGAEGYSEVYLKRTHVIFRLPPRLRPENSPRPMPVVVEGKLVREGNELVCEVTSLVVQPNDVDRLDQAVAALPAKEFETRKAWGVWAENRGKSFKPEDKVLIQRGKAIQAEALRIEAERKQVTVDAPAQWLALAEEARRRNIPEPDPSALAHKAFQAKIAAAKGREIGDVIAAINRFFPQAAKDLASGRIELGRLEEAYKSDPAAAYREAPAGLRGALNRRLYADALQRLLETEAAQDPARGVALAQQAEAELPERPGLATQLLTQGLDAVRRNLGALHLSELKTVAQTYREKLRNPQTALELYRDWLKLRRERLSDTDAEGHQSLAVLYEELLQDRGTAIDLLQKAWKIEPGSKEVAEAFRARGYRRVGDQWMASDPAAGTRDPGGSEASQAARLPLDTSSSLRGKTPEEVTEKLGAKPNRKVYSGTKGQLIEQWIYHEPTKDHFISFLLTPGDLKPRVICDYFLPRRRTK
jgi:tetratricopeptide (TPR) repeat protein